VVICAIFLDIFRVFVDVDIHGYISGYIHVWIPDVAYTMDISMDISTSFNLNSHVTNLYTLSVGLT